jgi:hypothetical protein
MPDGELNKALVPTPSEDPTLLPTNTLTTRVLTTTWRIRWLLESATRANTPDGARFTPFGKLNIAFDPTPLELPGVTFLPANDDTVEVGMSMRRIRWFRESATTAELPSKETLTPVGPVNKAFEPTPSVLPGGNPANTLTSAVDRTIFRITENSDQGVGLVG